jgi:hypothetical protein
LGNHPDLLASDKHAPTLGAYLHRHLLNPALPEMSAEAPGASIGAWRTPATERNPEPRPLESLRQVGPQLSRVKPGSTAIATSVQFDGRSGLAGHDLITGGTPDWAG